MAPTMGSQRQIAMSLAEPIVGVGARFFGVRSICGCGLTAGFSRANEKRKLETSFGELETFRQGSILIRRPNLAGGAPHVCISLGRRSRHAWRACCVPILNPGRGWPVASHARRVSPFAN